MATRLRKLEPAAGPIFRLSERGRLGDELTDDEWGRVFVVELAEPWREPLTREQMEAAGWEQKLIGWYEEFSPLPAEHAWP